MFLVLLTGRVPMEDRLFRANNDRLDVTMWGETIVIVVSINHGVPHMGGHVAWPWHVVENAWVVKEDPVVRNISKWIRILPQVC